MNTSNVLDSVFSANCNRVKRKIQQEQLNFDNIIDLVVFVMQEVETCEYVSKLEKQDLVIRIIRALEFEFILSYNDTFISKIIKVTIDASNRKYNLNKKRGIWKRITCGTI